MNIKMIAAVILTLSVSFARSQLFTGTQQSSLTCRQRCPRSMRPVCSTIGNTHWNECVLRCRGEWKQCPGSCPCGGGLGSMWTGANLQPQTGAAGQTLLNQLLSQGSGNLLGTTGAGVPGRGLQGAFGQGNSLMGQGNLLGQSSNFLGQRQGLLGQGLFGGNNPNSLLGTGNVDLLGLGGMRGLGQNMQNQGLLGPGSRFGAGLVPNSMIGQTLLGQGTSGGFMSQMLGQGTSGLMGQGAASNMLSQGLLGQTVPGLLAQGSGNAAGQAQAVDSLTQASLASMMMGGEGGDPFAGEGDSGLMLGAGDGRGNECGCPNNYTPVCTTGGVTFANSCKAQCDGKFVACQGMCPCP